MYSYIVHNLRFLILGRAPYTYVGQVCFFDTVCIVAVLFNPFHSKDDVFLRNPEKRKEYVLRYVFLNLKNSDY